MDSKRIELLEVNHAEEMNEIIGKPPSRITRWGITSVAVFVAILLLVSYVMQYSEIVTAELKINSRVSPKPVVTRTDGKIIKLFVKEDELVENNSIMGYIESLADHEEVLKLSEELNNILKLVKQDNWNKLLEYDPANYNRLGELQAPYQTFISQSVKLRSFLSNGLFVKQMQLMEDDINSLKALQKNFLNQQLIYEKDYLLAQQEFSTQEQLYKEKVLAKMEYNHNESKLINKQLPVESIKSSIISNKMSIAQKEQEILRLKQEFIDERSNFMQALNTLISNIDNWKRLYLIIAPIEGKVIFSKLLQENEQVAIGEELFYISPASNGYFGEMYVSQENFGKVEVGQPVLLSVASYPAQEYGKLRGNISFISSVPNKDLKYLIMVSLDKELISDNAVRLNFRNDLVAHAEIITRKKRLIRKLVYSIAKLLDGPLDK